MDQTRAQWIDIAKGFGIILVVWGHLIPSDAKRLIFMFHMPLFFIISGILFRESELSMAVVFKKLCSLGIPYLSFLVLFAIVPLVYRFKLSVYGISPLLMEILKIIIGGRYLGGQTGVFWFVSCLFFTQLLASALWNLDKVWVRYWAIAFMYMLALLNSKYSGAWLPLNINVVLCSILYFGIGIELRSRMHVAKRYFAIIVALAVLGIVLLYHGFNNTNDMKYASYGIPVVTVVSAASVSIVILIVCQMIAKYRVVVPMSFLGRSSLFVMYMHIPVYCYLNGEFLGINAYFVFVTAVLFPAFLYFFVLKYRVLSILLIGNNRRLKSGLT